jgi:hypothetical protein
MREGMLVVDMAIERPEPRSVCFRLPVGARARNVRFNGKDLEDWVQKGCTVCLAATGLGEQNHVELVYEPAVMLNCNSDCLRELPYVVKEKPNCVIVCDKDNSLSARRLSAYFEYWHLCQNHPRGVTMEFEGEGPRIPIHQFDRVPQDASFAIVVGCPQSNPVVARFVESIPDGASLLDCRKVDDRTFLLVAGANPTATERAVLRLLAILDEKYPFYGAVPDSPMFVKAGLAGKVLLH